MSTLLRFQSITKSFRGLRALANVSGAVASGAIVALIGPNGAGKTTLFNIVAGVFPPDAGEIHFDGRLVNGLRPDEICRAGIGRTFQMVKPFAGLSVLDNVVVGALKHTGGVAEARRFAETVLDRFGLAVKRDFPATTLTLPDQKRLEVARAFATRPRLLLLDEVMAGLRPTECDRMVSLLREVNREEKVTIVLIEHVMRAVMALAREIFVLNHGEVVAHGTPEQITQNPAVLACYLGDDYEL